jgi:hypothetical protein
MSALVWFVGSIPTTLTSSAAGVGMERHSQDGMDGATQPQRDYHENKKQGSKLIRTKYTHNTHTHTHTHMGTPPAPLNTPLAPLNTPPAPLNTPPASLTTPPAPLIVLGAIGLG